MIETVDIVLPLEKSEDDAARRQAAAIKLGVPVARIGGIGRQAGGDCPVSATVRQVEVFH